MKFKQWLEYSTKEMHVRSMIIEFLMEELKMRDPSEVLALNTASIEPGVLKNMFERGLISKSNIHPNIDVEIRNGITIADLIKRLSDEE